jgi:hypothetical protein
LNPRCIRNNLAKVRAAKRVKTSVDKTPETKAASPLDRFKAGFRKGAEAKGEVINQFKQGYRQGAMDPGIKTRLEALEKLLRPVDLVQKVRSMNAALTTRRATHGPPYDPKRVSRASCALPFACGHRDQ